ITGNPDKKERFNLDLSQGNSQPTQRVELFVVGLQELGRGGGPTTPGFQPAAAAHGRL
ncbi:hypothetical protein ACO22_08168, partial [Paracoccidioides brasiliensis]